MSGGTRVFVLAIVALAAPGAAQESPPALKDLLQAYWDGDVDVVSRRFARGRDVDLIVPAVRNWIATDASASWPMATAVLLLDLATTAIRAPEPSPQTAIQLITWGRDQITSKAADRDPRANSDLEKQWHQTAIGLLQGIGAYREQLTYVERLERRFDAGVPPRFWLARGIALDQQAARLTGDRVASVLGDAAGFYDRAARDLTTRAEASARAAFVFIRLGRHRDAMRRLDLAGETADVAVAAWVPLLRSRALEALGEPAEARLNAELAAKIAAGLGTSDPWTVLERGDDRFVAGWLPRLRAALVGTTSTGTKTAPPASFVTLDQYDRREYANAIASLAKMPSLEAFSKDYRLVADRWTVDAGPAHVDRRRAVVAVVALEAARARGVAEWVHAHLLLEWACTRLRASETPTELERLWMRAASALIEGAASGAALELHTGHALVRFPGDPALVLARAVASELRAGPDLRTSSGTHAPGAMSEYPLVVGEPAAIAGSVMPTQTQPLAVAIIRLQEAAKVPEIQREAQLRLGYTALRQGRYEAALGHLDAAAPAGAAVDPFIDYLVHLFRGRALDRLKRWDLAVAAYRKAVEIQPGAQSAELALAAALFRAGHRAEAAEIADRALARRESPPDPWLGYGQSAFRHWSTLVDGLRRAIQ